MGSPGDWINANFVDKWMWHSETLGHKLTERNFNAFHKNDKFVTKIVLTHGVLTAVEDHEIMQRAMNNGQIQTIHCK